MPRSPVDSSRLSSYEEAWEAINQLIREGGSWSGQERNCFYINRGDGTFANASAAAGLDFIEDGRAFGVLDLDGDGDADLILKNRTGPQVRILRNDLPVPPGQIWLKLEGRRANRDAIGARVTIRSGGKVRVKTVACGSGFLSQGTSWLHFAFPSQAKVERIEIFWPAGEPQEIHDLPTGRRYRIREGDAPRGEDFRPASKREEGEKSASDPPPPEPDGGRRDVWLLAELDPPAAAFDRSPAAIDKAGGSPVSPGDFRGRELLIAFFSPACVLCARELREWAARAEEIATSGLRVLVVQADGTLGEGLEAAEKLSRDRSGTFTLARAGPEALAAYGTLVHQAVRWSRDLSVPMSLLLNRSGRVVKVYRGPVEWPRRARDIALLRQARDPARFGLPFGGTFHSGAPERDHFQLGIGYFQEGLFDEARRAFERAIERNPGHGEAHFNRGVVLGEIGRRAGDAGDPRWLEEERSAFERAVEIHPTFADAHLNLGTALARAGRLDEAELRFRDVLNLRPGHVEALLNLGTVQLARGRGEEALKILHAARDADSELPAVHRSLGDSYRKLGRRPEAVKSFRRALELDPADVEARSNLAVLLAEEGKLDAAAAELERVLEIRPRHASALHNFGLVRQRQGKEVEARGLFRRAIEADPSRPGPYLQLARSLRRGEEGEAAAEVLRKLLKIHPDHPQAVEMLAEIRE